LGDLTISTASYLSFDLDDDEVLSYGLVLVSTIPESFDSGLVPFSTTLPEFYD